MKKTPHLRGFTLIELMIVVAILGIIASIAIPRFSRLIAKSQEATVKGSLGAIRSALSIYYGDNEGYYPTDDLSVLPPKFIEEIPAISLPNTINNVGHTSPTSSVLTGTVPSSLNDMAGSQAWLYDNNSGIPSWGRVIVNCSHQDYSGNAWSSL